MILLKYIYIVFNLYKYKYLNILKYNSIVNKYLNILIYIKIYLKLFEYI